MDSNKTQKRRQGGRETPVQTLVRTGYCWLPRRWNVGPKHEAFRVKEFLQRRRGDWHRQSSSSIFGSDRHRPRRQADRIYMEDRIFAYISQNLWSAATDHLLHPRLTGHHLPSWLHPSLAHRRVQISQVLSFFIFEIWTQWSICWRVHIDVLSIWQSDRYDYISIIPRNAFRNTFGGYILSYRNTR